MTQLNQKIFIESQWDERRETQTLVAVKAGGDRYAVTVPAPDSEAATKAYRDWVALYRHCGADVVLSNGQTLAAIT